MLSATRGKLYPTTAPRAAYSSVRPHFSVMCLRTSRSKFAQASTSVPFAISGTTEQKKNGTTTVTAAASAGSVARKSAPPRARSRLCCNLPAHSRAPTDLSIATSAATASTAAAWKTARMCTDPAGLQCWGWGRGVARTSHVCSMKQDCPCCLEVGAAIDVTTGIV